MAQEVLRNAGRPEIFPPENAGRCHRLFRERVWTTEGRETAFTDLARIPAANAKVRDAVVGPRDFNADANQTGPERRKLINGADEQFAEGGVALIIASRRQETWKRRHIDNIAITKSR